MAELIELKVPDIGDFDEVEIIEVLVAVGDVVEENQDLITLESDKAAMEIPATHAGVITALNVAVGDKVGEGAVIATIETLGDAAPVATEAKEEKTATVAQAEPAPQAAVEKKVDVVVEAAVPFATDTKSG